MSGKYLKQLISVNEAVNALTDVVRKYVRPSLKVVKLSEALGLVLARDIYAPFDHPSLNRSAVDGYAVRASDTVGASPYNPAILRIAGEARVGEVLDKCVGPGEAVVVHTGSAIPCGSDSVLMAEDCERAGDTLKVYRPVSAGQNVSRAGEDYREGELLIARGDVLGPADIAVLSSAGIGEVEVYERIRVGVITMGDEVVEPGRPRRSPAQVYDSSGILMYSILRSEGVFDVKYYGIVEDDPSAIRAALERAARENDIIVTTGGTGVSESDRVFDVVSEYGEWVFRGVKMRPGRPTSASIFNGRPAVHLSGFPVAAWTGYEAIMRPAIISALGLRGLERLTAAARLSRRLPGNPGLTMYVRVKLNKSGDSLIAEPYVIRGSGVLTSLLRSDGYVVVPENVEGYEAGALVTVYINRLTS